MHSQLARKAIESDGSRALQASAFGEVCTRKARRVTFRNSTASEGRYRAAGCPDAFASYRDTLAHRRGCFDGYRRDLAALEIDEPRLLLAEGLAICERLIRALNGHESTSGVPLDLYGIDVFDVIGFPANRPATERQGAGMQHRDSTQDAR